MWKIIKAILLIAVVLFFATFAVENSDHVSVNWYFLLEDERAPLYALLYGFFALGIFLGMIIGGAQRLSLWRKNKELEKENARLRDENINTKVDVRRHNPDTPEQEQP